MKPIILILLIALVSCGPRRPGKLGPKGDAGNNGEDGYSLVVDVVASTLSDGTECKRTDIFQDKDRNNFYSTGDTYQNGFLVCDGAIGSKGDKGDKGDQGDAGEDGLDADITYQIVSIVDPCGLQHAQGFDEVILKLGNGTYLSSFSDNANGKNTRFGILPNGNYITTDGTDCHFSLPIL